MKAKCPFCQNGCDSCDGGFIEVHFPKDGIQWDKICIQCGVLAGGCFSGPGLPEPSIHPNAICPRCKGKHLKLVKHDSYSTEGIGNQN